MDDEDDSLHWGWYVAGALLSLLVMVYGFLWFVAWKNVHDRVIPEVTRLHEESLARFKPVTVGDDIIYKNYNKCMKDSIANVDKLLDETVYRADGALEVGQRFYEVRSAACLNKTVEATANVSGSGKADLLNAAQQLVKAVREKT